MFPADMTDSLPAALPLSRNKSLVIESYILLRKDVEEEKESSFNDFCHFACQKGHLLLRLSSQRMFWSSEYCLSFQMLLASCPFFHFKHEVIFRWKSVSQCSKHHCHQNLFSCLHIYFLWVIAWNTFSQAKDDLKDPLYDKSKVKWISRPYKSYHLSGYFGQCWIHNHAVGCPKTFCKRKH